MIAVRGARQRVEIDLAVDRDHGQPVTRREPGHRRSDGAEAYDKEVDDGVGHHVHASSIAQPA